MATVQELAQQMSEAFETRTRDDGSKFVALRDGSPEWMTDVVRAAHGDKLPDNTVYALVEKSANALADMDDDAEPEDMIYEIEPSIYTHELTGWLHARADHVFYLDEALTDFGPFDSGFNLLAAAQKIQIDEIGFAVLEALRGLETDEGEEETEEA